jgi:hypothetical protein
MKKSFIVLTASLLCVTAFAQGKVSLSNDSLHLVYWGPTAGPYYGQPVNSDTIPPSFGLTGLAVDLYMGTSSSQLYLYSTTTMAPLAVGAGKISTLSVIANANPATGAPLLTGTVFVEVQVRDTGASAPNIFTGQFDAFKAYGKSAEFSFTLGTSITYPPLWNQTSGTWPIGTFNMDQSVFNGFRGAIEVNLIPEPSTFALAGLGAAAMMIFLRRK